MKMEPYYNQILAKHALNSTRNKQNDVSSINGQKTESSVSARAYANAYVSSFLQAK